MHLELVEALKCPNAHAAGVLVASADEIENRFVLHGLLGCPHCLAEFSVEQGVTSFAPGRSEADVASASAADHSDPAMRLAAQLGLSAGRTTYAAIGFDLALVMAMRTIVAARMLVFNASDTASFDSHALAAAANIAPIGIATIADSLPMADRKFDGIAFDARALRGSHSDALLLQAVTALRPRARLVAPVSAHVPKGMKELVRDAQVWVAEREVVATAPISILRRAE